MPDSGEMFPTYELPGAARGARLDLYEKLRELTDERLRTDGRGWTVVIDFPFDEGPYGRPTIWRD